MIDDVERVWTIEGAELPDDIITIGGGLIERKHLEKWIKRFKFKNNMDLLKNLFVEQ